MKKLFLFAYIIILNIVPILPQNLNENKEITDQLINIMKLEFRAFQTQNPNEWKSFVDDSAIFVGENDGFKTKNQLINEIKSAPKIFKNANETYGGVLVKVFHNTAVLTCITNFSVTDSTGNVKSIYFRFTRVHVLENNQWKLVYHSALPI